MPAPKSVTKTLVKNGKTEVQYTTNVDAAQYYLFELSRAALRDVAKFVTKTFRNNYYLHFSKHTGNAGKAISYKIFSSKSTKYPRVQIGMKKTTVKGFYGLFQEFGASSGVPRLGLLTHAVQDNVPEIIKIESQYLSGLSDEAERLNASIDENDMEGDADD